MPIGYATFNKADKRALKTDIYKAIFDSGEVEGQTSSHTLQSYQQMFIDFLTMDPLQQ